MRPTLTISKAVLGLGAALAMSVLAQAQTPVSPAAPTPVQAGDRYRFTPVEGGVLRLDSQSGQISYCRQRDSAWTCETVADDRAALEKEIARLQERVAGLEKQVAERGPGNRLQLPTDAELEQAMSFFERMMRRFRGMVETLKREWESDAPGKT